MKLPTETEIHDAVHGAGEQISVATATSWRNGRRPMPVWAAHLVVEATGVDAAELLKELGGRHLRWRRAQRGTP